MVLSNIDRNLLERCLSHQSRAWEDFVDRFLGLILHVVDHAAQSRSIRLQPQDREDLAGEVLLAILDDDFAVLRRFRGESSLATYLTVISRRVVVNQLMRWNRTPTSLEDVAANSDDRTALPEERIEDREEVEQLLKGLNGSEADVVRMYHLEGHSYQEISSKIGMPENSVGPTLSRAREKMRRTSTPS